MRNNKYTVVIQYTAAGMLLGLMLVLNGWLLNYQSGFRGPWFHIFDYSPDFAVIILSPLLLSLLFCFIGIKRQQLQAFNEQIKYNLSQEQLISSAADQQVKLLAKVVSQVNEGVIIFDKAGLMQWVNDGFTAISGYTLQEVQGKKAQTFLHGPLTDREAEARIEASLVNGQALVEEILNYRKDGSTCWLRLSIKPIYNDAGEITNHIAIESDITNRKEKELAIEALYKEVADYKFALDQSAIVIIFNTLGKIEHVNKKFCEINGRDKEELIGNDYRSISLSMRDKSILTPIWANLLKGKIWRGELVNRNHNGKSYWAETTIVPLLDNNGKPHHFLAIQNDITERKELENELLTSKNKLEQAVQIAMFGTWEIDALNNSLYLSKELKKIYGFNAAKEISSDELFSRMHPEDVTRMRSSMCLTDVESQQSEVEYRFLINGQVHYMVSNIAPRVNEEGKVTGSFGTAKDITQRKLVDLALKKSEEEKAVVLDNAQTIICIHDMTGIIIDVNVAGEKMSGFNKEEIIGSNLKSLVSPDYQQKFDTYIVEINEHKKAAGSLQIITKSGQKRAWLFQNTVYDNNGNTPYVIASAIDITDSVKAQNEIEKQQQFIRQIIDNTPNMIFVMNEQLQIVLANKTFSEYYNYNEKETPFAAALCKGEQDIFLGDAASVMDLEEGEIIRMDASISIPGDTNAVSWFNIIKKCFKEKNGKKYVLGFGMDITDRYQVQSDLMAANEMVERSLKVKDQFIANMSHEIRTPLNAVIGFTDILAETSLNKSQGEYVQIVKTASQNLLALINNILDLSKIESGNLALEILPVDIKQIVTDAIKILEPKAKGKGIDLRTNFTGHIPEKVLGDQLRLSQILFNLLGNAIKFTDTGYVEIGCKMVQGTDADKHYISFTVKDTGIGVPEDKQNNIFERFTQANVDTQRLYGGTGLGLNIAKSIVDMHGGTLKMESIAGHGTLFHFILPFSKYEAAQDNAVPNIIDADKMAAINAEKEIHILLVEDNMINAMLAIQVLKNAGVEKVEHVVNGLLAVEAVQQQKFDIVLMDIQMPQMNGIDATKAIRQLEGELASIPIVAMTAHTLYGEMQNCYNAGMTGYVSKPFKPENLYTAIVDALKIDTEKNDPVSIFELQISAS